MKPLKFQHASLWKIQQLSFLLSVSLPWIIAFNEAEGDKTFNLNIGFDLTHGSQETPLSKIRNFEDDDRAPHNDGKENSKRVVRAQDTSSSSSSSIENQKKKVESNVELEMKAAEDSAQSEDDSDDSSGDRKQRSTKGIRPDEYETEAGPAVRGAFDKDSETENSN